MSKKQTDEETSMQSTIPNNRAQNEVPADLDEKQIDLSNPQNWSSGKKLLNFVIVFLNAFISFFSSSIYVPALLSVQQFFKTDITVVNATIALYIMVSGVAPLFWAPLSDRIGRKPTYFISMVLFVVFSVLCAVSTHIAMFFVFRLLQGIAASAAQAIGGGSVADMYNFQSRGKMMSIFLLGTVFGPFLGPIVGGYTNLYHGWTWIFWVQAIIGGFISLLNVFLLTESLYRPNRPEPVYDESKSRMANWWTNFKFNPFTSLALLLRVDVLMGCLPMAVSFGLFYCLVTVLQPTFATQYGFSSGSVGLCFLGGGIGNLLGSVTSALTLDRLHFRLIAPRRAQLEQKGEEYKPGRFSELRLIPSFVPIFFLMLGFLFYGWFLESDQVWIAPLVGLGVLGFGLFGLISISTNYLIEGYVPQAASMTSVCNFARCLFGMIFSLLSTTIWTSLGSGWTYTMCALIIFVVSLATIPVLFKYGYKWRTNPVFSSKH